MPTLPTVIPHTFFIQKKLQGWFFLFPTKKDFNDLNDIQIMVSFIILEVENTLPQEW